MKTNIRNKLLLICGSGTALLLLAAAIGFWMLWGSVSQYENKVVSLHADAEAILGVQVDFKMQV